MDVIIICACPSVPPVGHILNPNIVKEEGEAVTIECQVHSLYNEAKPAIKWFHNSQDLAPAVVNGKIRSLGLYVIFRRTVLEIFRGCKI